MHFVEDQPQVRMGILVSMPSTIIVMSLERFPLQAGFKMTAQIY